MNAMSATFKKYPFDKWQPDKPYHIFDRQIPDTDNLCELCFSRPINTSFNGCSHRVACSNCIIKKRITVCLKCRDITKDVFEL